MTSKDVDRARVRVTVSMEDGKGVILSRVVDVPVQVGREIECVEEWSRDLISW